MTRRIATHFAFATLFLIASVTLADVPLNEREARKAPDWITEGVMYQIQPRAFTPEGTLKAATARLPKVAEMGATIVYLCPVFLSDDDMDLANWSPRQKASKMNNPRNPYRMKDFYRVDPEYGTEDDLKAFVAEAHRLGMRVMLDMVFLHCGPKPVFLEEHPDFVKRDADGNIVNAGWSFPALNLANPELREYLWRNMEMWVTDFGVDGFRCDVSDGIPLDFWETARDRLEALRPDVGMLAEGRRPENQLKAFDLNYSFRWRAAVSRVFDKDEPASLIRTTWEKKAEEHLRGARFIRYIDNHDISNDDWENRREKAWGAKGVETALVMLFTLDGVPFVYNGQEVADTARHSIFGRAPIDWANGQTPEGTARFAFCRKLCALRGEESALTRGAVEWLDNDAPDAVLSYLRTLGDDRVIAVVNLKNRPVRVAVQLPGEAGFRPLLARDAATGEKSVFELGAYGFFVGKK
ncbi:MAG: alpha-amylase family glycosyl hydrolase [Thermoguttaceae bacterium]|jgi:glycosidase|nr:alpha-amylase family glycosyl hydrolase [Thermoguttaceae bacterium]